MWTYVTKNSASVWASGCRHLKTKSGRWNYRLDKKLVHELFRLMSKNWWRWWNLELNHERTLCSDLPCVIYRSLVALSYGHERQLNHRWHSDDSDIFYLIIERRIQTLNIKLLLKLTNLRSNFKTKREKSGTPTKKLLAWVVMISQISKQVYFIVQRTSVIPQNNRYSIMNGRDKSILNITRMPSWIKPKFNW